MSPPLQSGSAPHCVRYLATRNYPTTPSGATLLGLRASLYYCFCHAFGVQNIVNPNASIAAKLESEALVVKKKFSHLLVTLFILALVIPGSSAQQKPQSTPPSPSSTGNSAPRRSAPATSGATS